MRIISGVHKGKKIQAPTNLPIRPTTDRAKESLFNILENRYLFENKKILDLFSGSGNISFEFSSRANVEITAVDNNLNCIEFIRKINKELNYNITTVQSDCIKFINNTNEKFDIIFMDPPYNYEQYHALRELIIEKKIINRDGCLIIEHDRNTMFEDDSIDLRKYGKVYFSISHL
ncbi:MAG: RsmD family RNA methyltransferase [Flavobacteriales bacterium]|nr:RsmD family RNA methyltransferase [Flavobacteriales bacterium]